eukprot:COSAG02_NODE_7197_length_3124_cov_5.976198_2_plen_82_part_00
MASGTLSSLLCSLTDGDSIMNLLRQIAIHNPVALMSGSWLRLGSTLVVASLLLAAARPLGDPWVELLSQGIRGLTPCDTAP